MCIHVVAMCFYKIDLSIFYYQIYKLTKNSLRLYLCFTILFSFSWLVEYPNSKKYNCTSKVLPLSIHIHTCTRSFTCSALSVAESTALTSDFAFITAAAAADIVPQLFCHYSVALLRTVFYKGIFLLFPNSARPNRGVNGV